MKTQFVDFEGNFGSQDANLQPTAETFALISKCIREEKRRRTVAAVSQPAAHTQHKKAA